MHINPAKWNSHGFLAVAMGLVYLPCLLANDASDTSRSMLTKLGQIEEVVLSPNLVEGPPRFDSLVQYYCEANQNLCERFSQARHAFADGQTDYQAVTLAAGSAGVGKTFIKRLLYEDLPKEVIWKSDLHELFNEFSRTGLAELTPDLQWHRHALSSMLKLTAAGRKAFQQRIRDQWAPFVIVDSIDEIHPHDYRFVLECLTNELQRRDGEFGHLVVFGRPLAFKAFVNDPPAFHSRIDLQTFLVQAPQLRTTGDLLVSDHNFDSWKFSLRHGTGEHALPVSFHDYSRWCSTGFDQTGEFRTVSFQANHHMTAPARSLLRSWAMQQRVVASVLGNLAGNGMAREIVSQWAREHRASKGSDSTPPAFDRARFCDTFLTMWLERDTVSDDRPSRAKPEYLDLYLHLLEATAVKYAYEGRVDSRGFFDVSSDDRVAVEHDGQTIRVAVLPILERSGLVTVDPEKPFENRFRFEPFWFHSHLVQMHQRRVDNRGTEKRLVAEKF